MFKKLLLSGLIGLTFQSQAEIFEKSAIKAGQPSVAQTANSTGNQLVLSVGVFDPLIEKLDFSQSKLTTIESSRYSIVQFNQGKADSDWLRKQGIRVVSYLPNNAFVIVSNNKIKAVLTKNSDIRWQGQFLSSYKIAPSLWNNNLKKQAKYDLAISVFNDFPKKDLPLLFKKYLPNTKFKNDLSGSSHVVKLSIDGNINEALQKLASIDAVKYINIYKPLKFLNTEAVSAVQANGSSGGSITDDSYTPNNTPIWDKGLIGSGQIVAIADTGLDSNEDWFVHYDNGITVTHVVTEAEDTNPPAIGTLYPDRKVIGYFVQPGAQAYEENDEGHGTHVINSVAGDRQIGVNGGLDGSISSPTSPGYDNDDGMAPNAQILVQDIGGIDHDGDPGLTGIGNSLLTQAFNANARIHSNSWGSPGDGAYTGSDSWADFYSRQYEDMLILVAAGNSGPSDNSIGSPANGKNVLSVGMLLHGNSSFAADGSSRGPTDDNRMKPDIMATGSSIESAKGNMVNNTTVTSPRRVAFTGTSMATPITAGSSALMRQYYTDGFYPTGAKNPADAHIPTGALMKATLINGAGIGGGHFDKDIGWGKVFLKNSIPFDDSNRQIRVWEIINKNGLKTDQSLEFKLGVRSDEDLAITLVWYDLAAAPGANKTLINDLDLVVKKGNSTYKGNVFSSVANSSTGGTRDSLNTVEQVRIKNPSEGIYTITVNATSIPGDGSSNSVRQGFALVATGNFDNIDNDPSAMTAITDLTSASVGITGTELTWSGGDNADFYEIYRVEGSCASADFRSLRYIGKSETNTFKDSSSSNGLLYSYKIRTSQYKTLGDLSAACTEITSEQACDVSPVFAQYSARVLDNTNDICQVKLGWNTAVSSCSATPDVSYNIYRSDDQNFIPGPDSLLASTVVGATDYIDNRALDTIAYYVVRAEDNSTTNSGPNNGNETTNTNVLTTKAIGEDFTLQTVIDDVDNVSTMTFSNPWSISSKRAADGALSYFSTYPNDACGSIESVTLSVVADSPNLEYQAFFDLEADWDGVVVEVSTDNGSTWNDFPPIEGYPGDFSQTTDNPVNACGYPATQKAFSGSSSGEFMPYSHDLSAFEGQDIKVRWRFSTDSSLTMEGFYLDSISYPNVQVPNACTINTAPDTPDKPQVGLYYDKGRSGHGFVVEPIANTDLYFTVFYTYKDDGTPEWYTSLSELENNVLNVNMDSDTLKRFTYDYDVDPTGTGNPNTQDDLGTNILKIDFNSASVSSSDACNDGVERTGDVALASWQLGKTQGDWCIQPLIAADNYPTPDFGGTWWTGADDDGWGLSLSFSGDLIVVTIYFFDPDGTARWVQGIQSGFATGQEINIDMYEYTGFARDADTVEPTKVLSGILSLTLNNNNGDSSDGVLTLDLDYQADDSDVMWSRNNMPVKIFTEAH